MTSIRTTLTHTVTLGSPGYTSPLDIQPRGLILPSTPGKAAIFVPAGVQKAGIFSNGSIQGAAGGVSTGNGGDGILQKLLVTSATFSGGTLTLLDGTTDAGSLAFAGTFTTADFTLVSDGRGGTDLGFAAAAAASPAAQAGWPETVFHHAYAPADWTGSRPDHLATHAGRLPAH